MDLIPFKYLEKWKRWFCDNFCKEYALKSIREIR